VIELIMYSSYTSGCK